MKKFLAFFAAIATAVVLAFGIAGCSDRDDDYDVYVPDGAPALSVAALCADKQDSPFDIDVVKADTIQSYVTGENPKADFAILPVNAAVKLLGDGSKYKMLGTVTHGNLFLLKKQGQADISSAADLQTLKGKTVGVINLANVPGLTFKVILTDNGIGYNELKDGSSAADDKVNLINVTAAQAIPSNAACDYFVVPEPAASTKVAATQQKLSFAGNLQTLYGGENGYPQAVAVVRTKIYNEDLKACDKFKSSFIATNLYLNDSETSPEDIVSAVRSCIEGDLSPTFTAQNLTKTVIKNCNIKFVGSADCKNEVLAFIEKLNGVSENGWGTPQDGFFA